MYHKLHPGLGEDASIAEELLVGISDLTLKCRSVEETVTDGTFALPEALDLFGVKGDEFIIWKLVEKLKEGGFHEDIPGQFKEALLLLVETFAPMATSKSKNDQQAYLTVLSIADQFKTPRVKLSTRRTGPKREAVSKGEIKGRHKHRTETQA